MVHSIRGYAIASDELTRELMRRLRFRRRYLYGQNGKGETQPHMCEHVEKDKFAAEKGARYG